VFNFNRGVNSSTPVNNYTLKLEFNGSFDFSSYPYPATFTNLPDFYYLIDIPRELRVYDYNDIQIYFTINGTPTREVYDNITRPRIFNSDQDINLTVRVVISGDPPSLTDIVRIYDVYNTSRPAYSSTFSSGYEFILPASDFHPGIHKFRVEFESYPNTNTTFIIINETITINVDPLLPDNEFIRDSESLTVTGNIINETIGLRGLNVSLQLFNSSGSKFSQYLVGSNFGVTDANGDFQIDISSIVIGAPEGIYYLRIDFNGSLFLDETPGIGLITNYMINTNSSLFALNITAGTEINQSTLAYITDYDPELPNDWVANRFIFISGNLTWDNTTIISGVTINVSIQFLNGTIIASNNSVLTDQYGGFNVSIFLDEVYPLPTERNLTRISVYFDPDINNMEFVVYDEEFYYP